MKTIQKTIQTSFLVALLTPLLLVSCNTSNISSEQSAQNANSNTTTKSNTKSNTSSSSSAASTSASIPKGSGIINISNEQLQTLIDKKITVVDIRRPEEWTETGVVTGSKKLTFFSKTGAINPKLVPELKKIAPTDQPVVLICRTGSRTLIAAQMIKAQLGYETVYNVEHGITKWIADGRKVVK